MRQSTSVVHLCKLVLRIGGEQPLPPNGACLLGSFNLTKYIVEDFHEGPGVFRFDMTRLMSDIPVVVRAMDNIIDRAIYPLWEQEAEALAKRRMGLGVTGVANALEALGHRYGDAGFIKALDTILSSLTNEAYATSALLAHEKGVFPLYDKSLFANGHMYQQLCPTVQKLIEYNGLRNSHLTSVAPTGTISLAADNVSSGIEPVFSYGYDRTIQTPDGPKVERVDDYGVRVFGVRGKTTDECTLDDHLNVLLTTQKWIDSAVSKTCNVGDHVSFDEFKDIYMRAYEGGAKGITTFRAAGKRMGILNAAPKSEENEGSACWIDPVSGRKSCE